jgi:hypothetical protein
MKILYCDVCRKKTGQIEKDLWNYIIEYPKIKHLCINCFERIRKAQKDEMIKIVKEQNFGNTEIEYLLHIDMEKVEHDGTPC